jgi:hypothetical protein
LDGSNSYAKSAKSLKSARSLPVHFKPFIELPPTEPYPIGPSILQESDRVPLSSGMFREFLPHFSNFDFGFLYEFSSKGYNRSFFYSDLYLPIFETCKDAFFTQSHYGYNGFSDGSTYENGAACYRTDVSVGGGYRILFDGPSILGFGLNAFWDTSQLYGSWWNSWGTGLEAAIGLPKNGLLDLTANQYSNQFQNMQNVYNIWRKGDVNFDLEAGYSHGFGDGSVDVRCKYNAYQFTIGDNQIINGSKGGIQLATGDGTVMLGWEIGYDKGSL